MKPQTYVKKIKEQYESLPYPARSPKDEMSRLLTTSGDPLYKINHYCFEGKKNFNEDFKVLISGGGTGDSTIYLAEQLKQTTAKITYLDLSQKSMRIAQERAKIRNLNNISWIHASILDLPSLNLGEFDFINCTGVLHHLSEPAQGLKVLSKALSPNGAIYLMVYAKYGRTGIYQMQELMRRINDPSMDISHKLTNTKALLNHLPETNWFSRDSIRWQKEIEDGKDAEIYDLFLNEQDVSYTVNELYQLSESQGLNLVDFIPGTLSEKSRYQPGSFVKNEALLKMILSKPKKEQQAISELISGYIRNHEVYLSRGFNTQAKFIDRKNIPTLYQMSATDIFNSICQQGYLHITVNKMEIKFTPTPAQKLFFKYIDGKKSIQSIISSIHKELKPLNIGASIIFDQVVAVYKTFHAADLMFLHQ